MGVNISLIRGVFPLMIILWHFRNFYPFLNFTFVLHTFPYIIRIYAPFIRSKKRAITGLRTPFFTPHRPEKRGGISRPNHASTKGANYSPPRRSDRLGQQRSVPHHRASVSIRFTIYILTIFHSYMCFRRMISIHVCLRVS